ncbi:MAG: glycogen/starch/alpha-glucan phosphorylase [Gracilibacteraceae bacterium]|jgi:starch phosphorylase|nr:glycogen/starch/alpha-glucan phosphorylase [Gracilibacteraceae bacterium]
MFKDKDEFKKLYSEKYAEIEGRQLREGTAWERYYSLVQLIKERVSAAWIDEMEAPGKQVYYFSMEFLIGRLLPVYLDNLGVTDMVKEGLLELGISLEDLIRQESDAGLGNGGLGRLAACFLDSMASLGVPGHGNGIRYRYGLFEQKIMDGKQAEVADDWLKNGYPWETRKPGKAVLVKFKGHVRTESIEGKMVFFHDDYESIRAIPYDIPVVGYDSLPGKNILRLWSAEPVAHELDLVSFNAGDFAKAVSYKSEVEAISYILYPEDSNRAGRELRLKQQYFFVAAGLASIIRHYKERYREPLKNLPKHVAIHINDTHPVLCIPELMRILVDEENLMWEEAWKITVNTISFTNHTILPEALERWPVDIFKYLLPRVYMIVEEIDRRFCEEMAMKFPMDWDLLNQIGIIKDHSVCMVDLAIIGSHSVNGVAELHSQILRERVLNCYYRLFPYKFNNKTNGVTHRRFMAGANPRLAALIDEAVGPAWRGNTSALRDLLAFRNDEGFLEKLHQVKRGNKQRLARFIKDKQGVVVDPDSVFDIQVKRIHAYKRQLLNVLRIMDLYNRLSDDPDLDVPPQTFIFGGKAAPGYNYAKEVIMLINAVAELINSDALVRDRLKVVFLENFNVSLAELIYPAADVSVQISTASKEASGTGNMKFMMNGAITFGTLDGATVEISNAVGDDHIIIFGLKAEEVMEYYTHQGYLAWDEYEQHPRLRKVVDQVGSGLSDLKNNFQGIYNSLLRDNDEFFVLKDFMSCVEATSRLHAFYTDQKRWRQSSLINIASSGFFSSDRTIRDYSSGIWRIPYREIKVAPSQREVSHTID